MTKYSEMNSLNYISSMLEFLNFGNLIGVSDEHFLIKKIGVAVLQ